MRTGGIVHRGCTGNAERGWFEKQCPEGSCQWSVSGFRRFILWAEPIHEAALEFLGCRADGSAMISGGNFPELGLWIECVDFAGVADGDVAVDLAVD